MLYRYHVDLEVNDTLHMEEDMGLEEVMDLKEVVGGYIVSKLRHSLKEEKTLKIYYAQ